VLKTGLKQVLNWFGTGFELFDSFLLQPFYCIHLVFAIAEIKHMADKDKFICCQLLY
jgi:hypothetical protein